MFIQVQLLSGYTQPLTYLVPKELLHHSLVGKIVKVPIQNRTAQAIVLSQHSRKPRGSFTIKPAIALEPFPQDHYFHEFIYQLSTYYQTRGIYFLKRMQFFFAKPTKKRLSHTTFCNKLKKDMQTIILTNEQEQVVDYLGPHITTQQYKPTLLHGVTGSGKTEVYKRLISQAHALKKTSLLMLPEVTLALQFEQLLAHQLSSEISIFSFHSATSTKNKRELWNSLLEKKPVVIIGVHLPILLPIENLGLIIVDEEHEVGYQEKKHPKVNSKQAAILRAKLYNIPILLGSATPSISSLYNVKTKGWRFFQLKRRFAGAFPKIKTVFLTENKHRRNFWISKELEQAIKNKISKKEQVIIFLNRRGYSFFVQCKICSFIFECSSCSVSLTLHNNNQLTCHYCGFSKQLPEICTDCKAESKTFLKKGIGTQQVVSILQKLIPTLRIGRADLDTTTKKKVWQQTMNDFKKGDLDILVGTQSITKGYHFPRVTLVGILWADLNLHFPVYNATETTLQQLIQVAGRAGRQSMESSVIVQAMQYHPVFSYLNEVDYLKFYQKELATRKEVNYPPCTRLVEIELKNNNEVILSAEANILAQKLTLWAHHNTFSINVLGPAKPPVYKIKKNFIRKIYLKGSNINDLILLFRSIDKKGYKSYIYFTPDPK